MLVIGYGNPGRGDDGLGPALAARIEAMSLPRVRVLIDYQLKVEHAQDIAKAVQVVFMDAAMGAGESVTLSPVRPADRAEVHSHALSPEAVLALAALLYGATPNAWMLAIRGEVFGDIREGLSAPAARNLDRAEAMFLGWAKAHAAVTA